MWTRMPPRRNVTVSAVSRRLLVFKGGQVKEQIVGYVSRDVIEKALEKNL